MKKLIISLVLIFLFSLSSVKLYVIASDVDVPKITTENNQIVFIQKMNSSIGKELVPKGVILGVNDVEEITFTYTIFVQYGVSVEYYVDDLKINDQRVSSEIEDLFNFNYKVGISSNSHLQLEIFDETEAGYFMNITVILTMDEPSEAQFHEIAGQQLSFTIVFESTD